MNKLKIVKKRLKQEKLWDEYVKKFQHKQMRLIFSRICLIFNSDTPLQFLIDEEKKLLKQKKQATMFVASFNKINQILSKKYNWKAFGKFMWYIFQTSTFYFDRKHKTPNIFTETNYVKQNSQKRKYYYDWLESIKVTEENFNEKIKKVLSQVF